MVYPPDSCYLEDSRHIRQQTSLSKIKRFFRTIQVMRCIIALFAEARGLLPVDNCIYQYSYSIDGLRQQLDRRASGRGGERLAQGRSSWPRLVALFNLIYHRSE